MMSSAHVDTESILVIMDSGSYSSQCIHVHHLTGKLFASTKFAVARGKSGTLVQTAAFRTGLQTQTGKGLQLG